MFRHPSYAGFFYWALGTQLVLQNPVSSIAYVFVLWKFFSRRIKGIFVISAPAASADFGTAEENALVLFFGQDYENYRRRVGTKIPFIR
jgi:protein-S-isoprenylcysteine O-methyltransferase